METEVFIVTVPTPIDETKKPDLKCLGKLAELSENFKSKKFKTNQFK